MGGETMIYLFGGFVASVTGAAFIYHLRRWRTYRKIASPDLTPELIFEERQQRRRAQQSLLGFFSGMSIMISGFILPREPLFGVWLVLGAALFIAWAMLLALGDIFSIKTHYLWIQSRKEVEQARIEAAAERRRMNRRSSRERKS
jgi:hypothetical protein